MDIDRQIKANQANGRFERQSAFAGQEMKVRLRAACDHGLGVRTCRCWGPHE